MNEKEFLRLLSGIDPELIADAAPKSEKLHEDAENDENTEVLSYDMREVRIVDMDAKAKKRRKIIIPALIAAVLMTGGVTAAVVASHGKVVIENSKSESSQSSDESSRAKLPDNAEPVTTLGLHLTDQQDQPAARTPEFRYTDGYPFEAAAGWYHNSCKTVIKHTNDTGHTWIERKDSVLCYSDKETGQTVPLCAKPECLHDGNLYCTATTKAYQESHADNSFIYYDGYLYRFTVKYIYDETGTAREKMPHTVLLRYEPDGTGITELHDFGTGGQYITPVLHRGYIWCCTAKLINFESSDTDYTGEGGFGIYGYELATGKLVTLLEFMPEVKRSEIELPKSMFGSGDYLYVRCQNWVASGLYKGLSRISLVTGKSEPLEQLADVVFTDGKDMLWYSWDESETDSVGNQVIHHRDLQTGKDEIFCRALEGAELNKTYVNPKKIRQDHYFYCGETEGTLCDGHLFISDFGLTEDRMLKIYDMNMKLVAGIPTEGTMFENPVHLNVQNGRLYAQSYDNWVYCEVSELLEKRENAEWHKAYEMQKGGDTP